MFVRQNPSNMRMEKAALYRRMNVFFFFLIPVVIAMIRRPPEYSLLHGHLGKECENELPEAIQLITTVGKVAMVSRRYEEHSQRIVDAK